MAASRTWGVAVLSVPAGSNFVIRCIVVDGDSVILEAETSAKAVRCPVCNTDSDQVHDRYLRRPQELPWRGHAVQLRLTVRRFRCPNRDCAKQTFAEPCGSGLPRLARRTAETTALLVQVAETAGGEAGARLLKASGLPTSPDTLLRLLRRHALPAQPTPRVLGVDDLSLRRRYSYATILVDMETRRPIELLPGREAETLATWLAEHPGVEVIVRDRAEAYAEGANTGAPDAIQVADRFHLLQNVGVALEEVLRSRRRQIEYTESQAPPVGPPPAGEARPPSATKQRKQAQRAQRTARWEQAHTLHKAGMTISDIARELGAGRRTVRQLLATPVAPRNRRSAAPPRDLTSPTLQPYVPYLQERWQAGYQNISQLFRELVAQDYVGSRSLLSQALQAWRPPRPPKGKGRRRRVSLRWLCLRPPDALKPEEQAVLREALATDPELSLGYDLLVRFRTLLADRAFDAFQQWLMDAEASALPPFVALARGMARDCAAVTAAFLTPWSNGMVEGHVHRVKLIKRQGYGRAKLDLLRRRVLAG